MEQSKSTDEVAAVMVIAVVVVIRVMMTGYDSG